MKKVHWTQTPAGKKRVSENMKQWHAKKGHNGSSKKHDREVPLTKHSERANANTGTGNPELDEATFAYALGHVECWIETYAASAGIPAAALASRMGKVLHSKAGR